MSVKLDVPNKACLLHTSACAHNNLIHLLYKPHSPHDHDHHIFKNFNISVLVAAVFSFRCQKFP